MWELIEVLLDLAALMSVFFAIFSVPSQFFRRYKRKNNGLLVTPMTVIIKQWLTTSLVMALLLMLVTALMAGSYMHSNGVPTAQIASFVITSVIVNIYTVLALGYTVAFIRKDRWSYSRNPQLIQDYQE